jgi:hypothetical protein
LPTVARLDRGVRGGRALEGEPPSDHRTQPPGRALGQPALGEGTELVGRRALLAHHLTPRSPA